MSPALALEKENEIAPILPSKAQSPSDVLYSQLRSLDLKEKKISPAGSQQPNIKKFVSIVEDNLKQKGS